MFPELYQSWHGAARIRSCDIHKAHEKDSVMIATV